VDISYDSVFVIIHDDPSYLKVCARWLPQQPTEKHMQILLWIMEDFLHRHSEGEGLLQQIVTGDKRGLIIISQTLIERVLSGNTPHVRTQTKIPTSSLCRQSDAALVWVCNGPILLQYFEHGTTAASYTIILKLKLKPAICNKRRGMRCQRSFFWSTIMCICILWQLLLNQSGS